MATAAIGRGGLAFFFCQLMTFPAQTMPGLLVTIKNLIFHIHIVTRITLLGSHLLSVKMVTLHAHIHFLVPPMRKFSNFPGVSRLHRYYFRPEISHMAFSETVYNTGEKEPYCQTAD
jgi:hypothetical protein